MNKEQHSGKGVEDTTTALVSLSIMDVCHTILTWSIGR